jgi:hypothetical protein
MKRLILSMFVKKNLRDGEEIVARESGFLCILQYQMHIILQLARAVPDSQTAERWQMLKTGRLFHPLNRSQTGTEKQNVQEKIS